MRIIEIISPISNGNIQDDPYSASNRIRDGNIMQRIAHAFTRGGAVKGLWNVDPFDQPPDAEPSAGMATSVPGAGMSAVPPEPTRLSPSRMGKGFGVGSSDPPRMPIRRY